MKWLHASLIQGPNHTVSFLPPFCSTVYRLALLLVTKWLPPCQASHPDAATPLRRRMDLVLWRWLSPVDLYFRARNDFTEIPQQNFLQVMTQNRIMSGPSHGVRKPGSCHLLVPPCRGAALTSTVREGIPAQGEEWKDKGRARHGTARATSARSTGQSLVTERH